MASGLGIEPAVWAYPLSWWALLAASTGIVGATVVTMGVLALPPCSVQATTHRYRAYLCHGHTGADVPPSIALVLLGDIMSTAYQQAQLQTALSIQPYRSVTCLSARWYPAWFRSFGLYLGYLYLWLGAIHQQPQRK